jgi:hypothetical protein
MDGEIQVTGLGKADFTSDLIIWDGTFVSENMDLQEAYEKIEADKELVKGYLTGKGVSADDIIFSAVKAEKLFRQNCSPDGNYLGKEFSGYELKQSIQIESDQVARRESISREITEVLNQGVQFYSQPPRYYYTKLADLKIEMISKATEDARLRAERIAEHSPGVELSI